MFMAISFTDHGSRFRLSDFSKLEVKWEIDNDARFCQYDVIVKFL